MKRGIMHRTSDAAALLVGIVVVLLCLSGGADLGHLTGSAVAGLTALVLALATIGHPRGRLDRVAVALTVGFIAGAAAWWPIAFALINVADRDRLALGSSAGIGAVVAVAFVALDLAASRVRPDRTSVGPAAPVALAAAPESPVLPQTPVEVASAATPDELEVFDVEIETDAVEIETVEIETVEIDTDDTDAIETDDTVVIPVAAVPAGARRGVAVDLDIDGEPSVLPRRAMPRGGPGVSVAS